MKAQIIDGKTSDYMLQCLMTLVPTNCSPLQSLEENTEKRVPVCSAVYHRLTLLVASVISDCEKKLTLTCSNSLADPLFSTSISKHRFKKSRNIGDSFSGFCSSGVPLVAIKYKACKIRNIV